MVYLKIDKIIVKDWKHGKSLPAGKEEDVPRAVAEEDGGEASVVLSGTVREKFDEGIGRVSEIIMAKREKLMNVKTRTSEYLYL